MGIGSTLAGSGLEGHSDGIGTAASFLFPMGVALDASGNLLVADTDNHRIRRIEGVVPPPWCPQTHHRYPPAARARAVELLLAGHQLAAEPRFEGASQSLLDAWVGVVMPHAMRGL